MKNTFAVSMTLLLALTLGGGLTGYRLATAEEKPAAEASAGAGNAEAGSTGAGDAATASGAPADSAKAGAGPVGSASDPAASTTSAAGTTGGVDMSSNTPDSNLAGARSGKPQRSGASAGAGTRTTQPGNSVAPSEAAAPNANAPRISSGPSTGSTNAGSSDAGSTNGVAGAGSASTPGAGDTAKGKAVFASAGCAGCHGPNAQGGIGPNLLEANGPTKWTLDQFKSALREGQAPDRELKAPMPQFTTLQISNDDIANLQAWLKTLK